VTAESFKKEAIEQYEEGIVMKGLIALAAVILLSVSLSEIAGADQNNGPADQQVSKKDAAKQKKRVGSKREKAKSEVAKEAHKRRELIRSGNANQ
jgi:hypothetical protein